MRLRKKHWAIPELKENKYIYFYPVKNKGRWREIFANDNPIYLEIGAGKGKFVIESAKNNPNINYIAMERDSNVFSYTGRQFIKEELGNVLGIVNIAENLTQYFSDNEIDKIYINFCNPWPKYKQHKRRLSHPRLLNIYKSILKNQGEIELKTDSREFFEDTIKYFTNENFEILEKSFDLAIIDSNVITEYENKWRGLSVPICFVKVKLNK